MASLTTCAKSYPGSLRPAVRSFMYLCATVLCKFLTCPRKSGESDECSVARSSCRFRWYTPEWYREASRSNLPRNQPCRSWSPTKRSTEPVPHESAEPLNDRPGLDRLANDLCACGEGFDYRGGQFVASELSQQLLLRGQVEVFVGQNLLLKVSSARTIQKNLPKSLPCKSPRRPLESACGRMAGTHNHPLIDR